MSETVFSPELCVTDRRGNDRRKRNIPVAVERRSGKDRRAERGERRRQIDPTTCERDYNNDEIEFMKAMDQYKRENRRPIRRCNRHPATTAFKTVVRDQAEAELA